MISFTLGGIAVKPLILTEETAQILQRELPRIGFLPNGAPGFASVIGANDSLLWQIGEPAMGIVGVANVRPGIDALGQIFIWDRQIFREVRLAITFGVIRLIFDLVGVTRITALVSSNNTASRRFTEDLGFILEGRLRSTDTFAGRVLDTLMYSLLRSEVKEEVRDVSSWCRKRQSI